MTRRDAVVVGSGPNGLAAAVELARAGLDVEVVEGSPEPGGGCRTAELTLPGFHHDVCSTILSFGATSPFFKTIDLTARGAELVAPPVALAHPLEGGRAALLHGSVEDTAASLGQDAGAYRRLVGPVVRNADALFPFMLAPLRAWPTSPVATASFGAVGGLPLSLTVRRFSTPEGRALLAGVGAHAVRPLTAPLTTAFALALIDTAHVGGWPVARGGTGRLVDALCDELASLGVKLRTGEWITDLTQLSGSDVVLLDTAPRSLVNLAGGRLTPRDRHALERFRHGPGVCKVDWALEGPVPWAAAECRRAGTVHVGGTFEEVAAAEADVARGLHPPRPFCIVVQACVADPTRAPQGRHTLWGYCHVPNGSTLDVTDAIEAQIERFAPGFRDLILARTTTRAIDQEQKNPNLVGGDVTGGLVTIRQTVFRPTLRWHPYRTGIPRVYLCSASTPPGAGVHGMCGVGAARDALTQLSVSREP